jgi:hypothetical protein
MTGALNVPLAAAAGLNTTAIAYLVAAGLKRRGIEQTISNAETTFTEAVATTQRTLERQVKAGLENPVALPVVQIDGTSVVIQVGSSQWVIKDGEILLDAKVVRLLGADWVEVGGQQQVAVRGSAIKLERE